MTCKDCIHQDACFDWCKKFVDETKLCKCFSDKSEWVHLSEKDVKMAYYAIGYGCGAVLIEEPIYGWGIKNGKLCVIDERGDFYEIGNLVFLKKDEAEKEVERRRNA